MKSLIEKIIKIEYENKNGLSIKIIIFALNPVGGNISLRQILLLILTGMYFLSNTYKTFSPNLRELRQVFTLVRHFPNWTYSDKIKEKVGSEYYEWTKLVRLHTDIESRIILPPQMWPWPQSGNPEFSQYFLYPAKLLKENRKALNQSEVTHVAIAWGEGVVEKRLYGWPQFPFYYKNIYYLPQNRIVEIKNLEILSPWKENAERSINKFSSDKIDITYSSSLYDYWTKDENIQLLPQIHLIQEIKSNWINSTSLIAEVSYGERRSAIFSSQPNQKTNEWEALELSDLYARAQEYSVIKGWNSGNMIITKIGLDTGHPAKMPYLEKWGIAQLEKGGQNRLEILNKEIQNSQNLFQLANVYSLENNQIKAENSYKEALILEPSNSLIRLLYAELLNQKNDYKNAEKEYLQTLSMSPEISWFSFALGEFYRKIGKTKEALERYDASLSFYPEGFWTHLSEGEIFEAEGNLEQAYFHYKLASDGPRKAFSMEAKIAGEKLTTIKNTQDELIEKSLKELRKDGTDIKARTTLASAYRILGNIEKYKEQQPFFSNKDITELNLDPTFQQARPLFSDALNNPKYGTREQGYDTAMIDSKLVGLIKNAKSYIKYPGNLFQSDTGTIRLRWGPARETTKGRVNLLFQFEGLSLIYYKNKFYFGIFNTQKNNWEFISSSKQNLEYSKIYTIEISYGLKGMNIFIDGKKEASSDYVGGINKNDLFIGRGPLPLSKENNFNLGYFEILSIFEYQK